MSKGNGLPEGWCWTTLGEIAVESMNGFGKRRSEGGVQSIVLRLADIEEGCISLESTRRIGATSEEIQKYALACDDLLTIRVNGSPDLVGRMVRFSASAEPILFCDHFIRVRLAGPEVARFVRFFADTGSVRHFVEQNKVSSAGQNTISQGTLDRLTIPLAPVHEQRRIVAKIEELFSDLDAGVAALKRAKANLKRYRAAVLKAAVEGKLTEAWRAEHPPTEPASKLLARILTERRQKWEAHQLAKFAAAGKEPPRNWKQKYVEAIQPDKGDAPELPHSWCWASVEQCADNEDFAITDGPFGSNLKSEHYTENGPRVIRLQNLGDGEFVDEDAHISADHFSLLKRHSVKAGDVITAMLGETLPRACIVPPHIPPAIVKADCVKIAPDHCLVVPKYLVFALNAHPTRVRASTKIAGVGRPRLNLQKLRPLAIPLPPPAEQAQIVSEVDEKFSQIDAAEIAIEHGLLRAARLRQSILKQAFEGKLVPQDSQDEPASVLLERLRASRPVQEGNGKAATPARTRARRPLSRTKEAGHESR